MVNSRGHRHRLPGSDRIAIAIGYRDVRITIIRVVRPGYRHCGRLSDNYRGRRPVICHTIYRHAR